MSNIDDFFSAGGVQVGDYLSTERTIELIDAKAQDIFGFGFAELEAIMSLTNDIESYGTQSNIGEFRAFCIQAHGRLGWVGNRGNADIVEFDFHTGERTTVDSGGAAFSGYFDACCSDIGDRIFLLGYDSGANDLFVITSIDSGVTWNDFTVFSTGFSIVNTNAITNEQQLGFIQCDLKGENLRIAVTCTTTNQTVVYESTDAAQTWAEILTPRVSLTDPDLEANSFISRDLSTTVMTSTDQMFVSSGSTGLFQDVSANYPGILDSFTKLCISDDGSVIAAWRSQNTTANKLTDKIIFHTSSNNGVNWLTHNFDLGIASDGPNLVQMFSAFFDPQNNDVLFVSASTEFLAGVADNSPQAQIFEVDIANFTIVKVGELASTNNTIQGNVAHISSDFKSNGSGFTYGIGDGSVIDRNYSIDIATGMLLLDTENDTQPLKISSGTQTNGLGTLGFSWTRLVSPTDVDMRSLYVSSDKTRIVISGAAGLIVNSTDIGSTFVDRTGAAGFVGAGAVFKIDGADDFSLVIASSIGEVRRSLDGGTSWSASTGLSDTGTVLGDNYNALSCIADGTTVIAGSRNDNLDVSTNSGSSFTLLATPFTTEGSSNTSLRSAVIAKGNDQIMFVGNEDGVILRSINGGTSFALPATPPVGSPDEAKVFDMACSSDGSIVFAALSDKLFLSTDTGNTWAEVAAGFTKVSYRRVSISDDGTKIFATDNNGLLVRSLDSGVSFFKTLVPWEETRRKAGVELSPDGTVAYVATDDALIYRTA